MNLSNSPSSSAASAAERVLQATLVQVRRRRQARRRVRIASAALAAFAAVWGTALIAGRNGREAAAPLAQVEAPSSHLPHHAGQAVTRTEALSSADDGGRGWAVVVMRDGTPSLEERRASELADVDLKFSLDPLIAHSSY